jgi:hypothetical protein
VSRVFRRQETPRVWMTSRAPQLKNRKPPLSLVPTSTRYAGSLDAARFPRSSCQGTAVPQRSSAAPDRWPTSVPSILPGCDRGRRRDNVPSACSSRRGHRLQGSERDPWSRRSRDRVVQQTRLDPARLRHPGPDGPQLLEELRKTHPDLPVVLVTACPDGELMAEAMKHRPLMLLFKPI